MPLKRVMFYLGIVFLIAFLIKEPGEAAKLVRTTGENAGDLFTAAADAFTKFLTSLI